MCVGPNNVMTGVSKAAAKWRGPESVVIRSADLRTHALVSPIPSGLIGQADHARVVGQLDDLPGCLAFVGPAQDQDGHARLTREPPRQGGEIFERPALGRAKRPAGVEADDPLAGEQPQRRPGPDPRAASSSFQRGGQLDPHRNRRGSRVDARAGGTDSRIRSAAAAPTRPARGIEPVGQKDSSRPYRTYPTRRGMPASQAIKAERNELGKRTAMSKCPRRGTGGL